MRMTGRWGRLPFEVIGDPRVKANEIAVLLVLASYADADGYCWPSQDTIARIIGKSRSTVIAIINRLVEIGLVERRRRIRRDGGLASCLYRLCFVSTDGAVARDGLASCDELSLTREDACDPSYDVPGQAMDICDRAEHVEGKAGGRGSDCVSERGKVIAAAAASCRNRVLTGSVEWPRRGVSEPTQTIPDSTIPVEQSQSLSRRRSCAISLEEWKPSHSDLAWASRLPTTLDIEQETERYRLTARVQGWRIRDISASWRRFLLDRASDITRRSAVHASAIPNARRSAAMRTDRAVTGTRNADILSAAHARLMGGMASHHVASRQ